MDRCRTIDFVKYLNIKISLSVTGWQWLKLTTRSTQPLAHKLKKCKCSRWTFYKFCGITYEKLT